MELGFWASYVHLQVIYMGGKSLEELQEMLILTILNTFLW